MSYAFDHWYERTMAKLHPYPINPSFSVFNLEVTTYCNSNCNFCAYERMIRAGVRPKRHMPYELAKQCIDWYDKVPKKQVLKFIPVGLGETLLYPQLMDVCQYAKDKWPGVMTFGNTNCISLSGEIAKRLIGGPLDQLTLSLCFIDEKDYSANLRTEHYQRVKDNIKAFLEAKGNKSPQCKIHVFDRPENRPKMRKFVKEFSPYLNDRDRLSIYEFVDLLSYDDRPVDKWYCEEMIEFDSLLADVEGNLYPCCSGMWKPSYKEMILGNVLTDDPLKFPEATKRFREVGPNATCQRCVRLGRGEEKKKRLPKLDCPVQEAQ